MAESLEADLCVIGAGSAGLSVAAGAARLGARVVLFERDRMGGDCLNTGCVPSKSLLAAAKLATAIRAAPHFGLPVPPPVVDFTAVTKRVHGVIAAIAPHDSVERFRDLGVRVVQAEARFLGPREAAGGGVTVRARRFVVATGSTAAVPPIAGLPEAAYFTNETIFDNTVLPAHLLVIGGGPVGLELAQAYRRLGAEVTVVEAQRILPRDDRELVGRLRPLLLAEGIRLREDAAVRQVGHAGQCVELLLEDGSRLSGTHLLVAAGRRPRTDGLGLDAAGIAFSSRGIQVGAGLRTTNRRVYAIGDVTGGPQFTHVAGYHAGIVIRNALFRMPAKVDYRALPWVTFTAPELAHVGLTEAAARDRYGSRLRVLRTTYAENDRAQAEGETEGAAKVILHRDGMVLGASILGANAGELIHLWALVISRRMGLRGIAGMLAPYPTLGEINVALARGAYADRLFARWPRRLVRLLGRLG